MTEQDTNKPVWELILNEKFQGQTYRTTQRMRVENGYIYNVEIITNGESVGVSTVFVPEEEDEDTVVHKLTALLVSLVLVSALAIISSLTGKYLLHIFTS